MTMQYLKNTLSGPVGTGLLCKRCGDRDVHLAFDQSEIGRQERFYDVRSECNSCGHKSVTVIDYLQSVEIK